ncbi:hypothetical protein Thimo_2269 [Thioflavicoccus mobilis 8321]|uniref:Uncharacterized protein n=1 Tax=Thioflavicoccus mobilis 8321 TaxID=765912 RepID=L0H0B0_9GAMM|nr:hypothetical protein [Thioflavicoccus mobilis]AGA91014.1 hypothetical protein Thimo_2269 [Thioflavicoccus mobilis 8321]
MIIAARAFGYAQARMQARYALLPDEAAWGRLAAARSLTAFLAEARALRFGQWVKGFSRHSSAHELERGVRLQFRDTVDAVAGWMPERWGPAVAWTRWLPYLPLFALLARGDSVPRWACEDYLLVALLDEAGQPRPAMVGEAGLRPLFAGDVDVAAAWLREWQRRWPPSGGEGRSALTRLLALFGAHLVAFRSAAPDATWPLRRELRTELRQRFRRSSLQPVTPFIFLALVALDLERLRAELVGRALFAAEAN